MPESTPETWEYSLHVPHDIRAVPVCRRTLRLILTVHGLIHLVDTAELIASEPVSNAVLHTKGPAALRIRWADGVLRVGVWDADPEPPDPPRVVADLTDAENGRGTALVRACAQVWGWHPLSRRGHRGKFVWCDVPVA
ncbi:ATP-binding protein [Streptomyces phaeoluteigriseus]